MAAYVNTFERLARLEALQEGEHDGAMRILRSLLIRRFGDLPSWAIEKLKAASAETIEAWSLRLLDARSVDEIFA